MSEQMAMAGARAAAQALRLVQASGSPYVMVKHGRREDRAAVYDRFMAACAGVFYDGSLDRAGTTELLVARLAVEVRAPAAVRFAAERLFRLIVGHDWGAWGISPTGWVKLDDIEVPDPAVLEAEAAGWAAGRPELEEPPEVAVPPEAEAAGEGSAGPSRDRVRDSEEFLAELVEFARIAREDVTARWWHPLVKPWFRLRRWWWRRGFVSA
ncbi:hypothetical protein AB0D90_31290 [Streptomyces althioticus]|uniref:hypothetical protein n=1 Tax=Streptomyces althioticus TaxID=83380 RepID=UPI00340DBCD8